MFRTLWRDYAHFVILGGIAVFAFGGWGGLAYSAMSSRSEIAELRAERDKAVADFAQLSKSAGELGEVSAKLARAKAEFDRTALAWADVRQKLAAAQPEQASAKRADPLANLISETGSVRPQPPKAPARKVTN